ncbi:unnamed protein product, partial [Brenthis ino]
MASKANVTFNIILISVAIILGNIVRKQVIPLNNDLKNILGYTKESLHNFTELSEHYGYMSEEHTVLTDDGYLLTIFRINSKKCLGKMKKPPVVLMHGLLLSSDAFLDAGPGSGLGFLLSDSCYDVWVGNQRGNYYARRHIRLNPDKDPDFWQFSVDEIGLYDIPAIIDYVLTYTKEKKLNYIGYSQGAGTFLIMCSERPGYCDKANILIGLAPAARQTHTRSIPYRLVTQYIMKLERIFYATSYHDFLAKGSLSQEFLHFFCQFTSISEAVCGTGQALFDSFHSGSIANKTLRAMFGHFPAGTSIHNMARYGQSMKSPLFQKFDYGKKKNLELYGNEQPPSYNLSAVTVPLMVLYGKNDYLVDTKDIHWLIKKVPNVLEAKEVSDPLWNHFDVAYSQYNRKLLLPKINEYLLKYSRVVKT